MTDVETVATPEPMPFDSEEPKRGVLVKMLPRTTPEEKSAEERALAGEFRVIHGSVMLPLDPATFTLRNGSFKPFAPKQVEARPGDIVWLNNLDAARLLDASIVEPANTPTHSSRLGKVHQPPKPGKNTLGYASPPTAPLAGV